MQRVLRPALPHTMGLWYGIKYREYWNYHHDQAFLGATDLKEEMWDQMIDDLYDLIGGRQTVCAGTEAFMEESSLRTRFVPFFRTTDMGAGQRRAFTQSELAVPDSRLDRKSTRLNS